MANDPFEYVTPPLKVVRDMVAIPRERYEALMAAVKILPDIAGLIERWEKRIAWTAKWEIDDRLDNDTIAALRALAQEAQRWKTIATDWHRDCDDKSERIRELEAERNAIRRKTIEECLAKLPEDTPAYVCAALRRPSATKP